MLFAEPFHRNAIDECIRGEVVRTELPRQVLETLARLAFYQLQRGSMRHNTQSCMQNAQAGPVACSLALRSGMFLDGVLRKDPAQLLNVLRKHVVFTPSLQVEDCCCKHKHTLCR